MCSVFLSLARIDGKKGEEDLSEADVCVNARTYLSANFTFTRPLVQARSEAYYLQKVVSRAIATKTLYLIL